MSSLLVTLTLLACSSKFDDLASLQLDVEDTNSNEKINNESDPYDPYAKTDSYYEVEAGCPRPVSLKVEAYSSDENQILDTRAYVTHGNGFEGYPVFQDCLVNYGYTDTLEDGTFLWEIGPPCFTRTTEEFPTERPNTWYFSFDSEEVTSEDGEVQWGTIFPWSASVYIRAYDQYRDDIYNHMPEDMNASEDFIMDFDFDPDFGCYED